MVSLKDKINNKILSIEKTLDNEFETNREIVKKADIIKLKRFKQEVDEAIAELKEWYDCKEGKCNLCKEDRIIYSKLPYDYYLCLECLIKEVLGETDK